MSKLIVIGGVAAGPKAALKAKRERPDWDVTLITNEPDITYSGCSLPYYIGGVLENRDALIVKTPDRLRDAFGIEVLTEHEVEKVDFNRREVLVKNLKSGDLFLFSYDQLVIASGASPVLPSLLRSDAENFFTLRTIHDGAKIKSYIEANAIRKVGIIGGSFIGLELAENIARLGISVSLIEFAPQLLPSFDTDIARVVNNIVAENAVSTFVGESAKGYRYSADRKRIVQIETDKRVLDADLVVVSVGVAPNTGFLKGSEAALSPNGAIKVDPFLQTTVPGVYAAGDCAENLNRITGEACWYPMGSTANKAGRICGENLAALREPASFPGVLGTMILKLFGVGIGKTGLTEKDAAAAGIEYDSVIIGTEDKPKHFPGVQNSTLKLLSEKATGRILGAQALGKGPIDKYLDTVAAALHLRGTVEDLQCLDLCYSPLFSTPISAINLAANVLDNYRRGRYEKISSEQLKGILQAPDTALVDVREEDEFALEHIPGSINLSFTHLRSQHKQIPKECSIILICESGKRAYMAYRYLKNLRYEDIKVLDGGLQAYPFRKASLF